MGDKTRIDAHTYRDVGHEWDGIEEPTRFFCTLVAVDALRHHSGRRSMSSLSDWPYSHRARRQLGWNSRVSLRSKSRRGRPSSSFVPSSRARRLNKCRTIQPSLRPRRKAAGQRSECTACNATARVPPDRRAIPISMTMTGFGAAIFAPSSSPSRTAPATRTMGKPGHRKCRLSDANGLLQLRKSRMSSPISRDQPARGREPAALVGQTCFRAELRRCHGVDGQGNRQFGAPNLTDPIWLYAAMPRLCARRSTTRAPESCRAGGNRLDPVTSNACGLCAFARRGEATPGRPTRPPPPAADMSDLAELTGVASSPNAGASIPVRRWPLSPAEMGR